MERWDICVFGIICDECGARGPVVERGDYDGDDNDLARAARDASREWNKRKRASKVVACAIALAEQFPQTHGDNCRCAVCA